MDGLLVVNKERGITSHDVVNQIRHIFKTHQVGHLGTLDPLATGVLVICINDATKLAPYLESSTKEYIAEIMVGCESDTYDIEGNILNTQTVIDLEEEKIDRILKSFIGKSFQTPPIYSAIKVCGKKLYEYARKNQDVEIPKREIEVFSIERISNIDYVENTAKFSVKIHVSKGTYIRSICHDFGTRLGIPCLMSNLERIRNGKFSIDNAKSLEQIKNGDFELVGMVDALSDYPRISSMEFIKKASNGMKISPNVVKKIFNYFPEKILITNEDKLVAIYIFDSLNFCYKAGRVWK